MENFYITILYPYRASPMKSFRLKYEDTELYFGCNSVKNLKEYMKGMEHAIIATGSSSARKSGALEDVENIIKECGVKFEVFDKIRPNPTVEIADKLAEMILEKGSDCIIAIGGGSVIDTAKVSSIIALSGGRAGDYLRGKRGKRYLPLFVVNLTHGTGSEVDRYAVLTEGRNKVGISARYPNASFDDPRYLMSLPERQAIYTSVDAFFHAYEAVTGKFTNPFIETLSIECVRLLRENLPRNQDLETKYNLLYASMIAGISLDMGPAHIVHAIEHALSGMNHNLPHGCGLAIIGARSIYWIHRYAKNSQRIIEALTGKRIESASEAEKSFKEFLEKVGFDERLSDYGFGRDDFKEVENMVFGELRYFFRRIGFNFEREMLRDILENSL